MKNPLTNRTARRNCTRSFTLIFPLLKNNMVYRTKDTTPNFFWQNRFLFQYLKNRDTYFFSKVKLNLILLGVFSEHIFPPNNQNWSSINCVVQFKCLVVCIFVHKSQVRSKSYFFVLLSDVQSIFNFGGLSSLLLFDVIIHDSIKCTCVGDSTLTK